VLSLRQVIEGADDSERDGVVVGILEGYTVGIAVGTTDGL